MTQEEIETVMQLSRYSLTSGDILDLLRLARRHHRWQEVECNGDLTAREAARVDRIEAKIRGILQGKAGVTFDGDPRGYTVKIKLRNGRSNHWGGETWGI